MKNDPRVRAEGVLVLPDGTVYGIPPDGLVLGRRADIGLMLNDLSVSRRHAQIEWRDGAYYVRDLNSSNGTSVNGEPVANERRLNDADVLRLGDAALTFRLRQATAVPELGGMPRGTVPPEADQAVIHIASPEQPSGAGAVPPSISPRLSITAAEPSRAPHGGAVVLGLSGVLDIDTVEQFKGEAQRRLEVGVVQFTLDLHQLSYLDSSGLGALAALHRAVTPRGGGICLQRLQPAVRGIIELTRLDRVFTVQ